MPINFPSNPSVNQTYENANRTWIYNGRSWIRTSSNGGASGSTVSKDITWANVQTANFTANVSTGYPVNTTSSAITVTLPASPSAGDLITLTDYASTWQTNNVTVSPNGNKINGNTTNLVFNVRQTSAQFVYIDATQGWKAYSYSVTSLPQTIPVDYLVVAGGGGGGTDAGGGGGAGGFRTGSNFLMNMGVSYTITVGSGGAAGAGNENAGSTGSNSVFSIITSNGGGGGGGWNTAAPKPGGSGGGGSYNVAGAAGNTPSTSPSQGNSGGNGSYIHGGGGGGAGAAGQNAPPGNGGAGLESLITGSSVYYAGGGGGAEFSSGGGSIGGVGGGGNGKDNSSSPNGNGSANTGGGGGGVATNDQAAGSGGSGVVIIAYPDTYPALASIGAGLTYNQPTRSGYRVYRFTAGTGTIQW
jgi:hypothetical protein